MAGRAFRWLCDRDDAIKALFAKVGVRSRTELVARIFTEHYFNRLEASVER